jgi:hypothetical protein
LVCMSRRPNNAVRYSMETRRGLTMSSTSFMNFFVRQRE